MTKPSPTNNAGEKPNTPRETQPAIQQEKTMDMSRMDRKTTL